MSSGRLANAAPLTAAPLRRRVPVAGRLRLTWGRALAAALALLLLVPNSSVLEHRAIIAVFLVALLAGRGRAFVRDWAPLVGVAAAFVALRQVVTLSPLPRQGALVAGTEAAMFGQLPSAALQQALGGAAGGGGSALAYAATAVHASYFFGFVVVGLVLWVCARHRFPNYVAGLALTFALGLGGYALLPTEPPWMAARDGLVTAPVQRVIAQTSQGTRLTAGVVAAGRSWQSDPDALGDPNPTAAMPSVHTAVTATLAIALWRWRRALGAAAAVYCAAMGFSLVYLGEHYVLDVVAGLACALLASSLAERRWPAPRPVRAGETPAHAAP